MTAATSGVRSARFNTAGEAHYNALLTEADVLAIRASKESNAVLARGLGVTAQAVKLARLGRTWGHLPGGGKRQENWGALPGEAHHNAKLTAEAVLALRAGTASIETIMERYGVSFIGAWKAKAGRTWKHLL